MEGVGPGTTLDGRYLIEDRLGQRLGAELWSAHDQDLNRDVSMLVLPAVDPRSPAVLDAARMAAGLTAPALVRILDIGEASGVAYVVEESLAGSRSLAELVRAEGLHGDEIRRMTGEVAKALETARQRGVHHLDLRPDDVFRTSEGEIKVRGLGTSAVLRGRHEREQDAVRTDTVGVVALAYAGLTGRTALADPDGSLPPAPRLGRDVAAPSEIVAGVPRDLDTLCRLTLSENGGPTSPGDYARQIAPWPSRPVLRGSATPPSSAASPEPSISADLSTPPDVLTSPGPSTSPDLLTSPEPSTSPKLAAPPELATPSESADEPSSLQPTHPLAPPESLEPPETLDPPAPLVPAGPPLTRDESKLALALVAVFVVLSLVVGLWGLSKIGSNTHLDLGSGVVAKPSHSPAPDAATSTDSLHKLAILSADGFDPYGDGTENSSLAPKVFDGNPDTAWVTEGYSTANLGGLKPGVGLLVDLGPNVAPRRVDLHLLAQADVSVYVSEERSLNNATKVGEQAGANGDVSFPVPEGTSGQYIIVWFTQLSRDSDGYYRGKLGEVTVYG